MIMTFVKLGIIRELGWKILFIDHDHAKNIPEGGLKCALILSNCENKYISNGWIVSTNGI